MSVVGLNNKTQTSVPFVASWLFIFGLLAIAVFLLVTNLSKDLTPHTWTIPAQTELKEASGHFEPTHGFRSPYLFRADSGNVIQLGCDPEGLGAPCLEDLGIDLPMMSNSQVTIGYFYVSNPHSSSLSNTLMSITWSTEKSLSNEKSGRRISAWARTEERMKRSPRHVGMDIGLSVFLVFVSGLATMRRFNI